MKIKTYRPVCYVVFFFGLGILLHKFLALNFSVMCLSAFIFFILSMRFNHRMVLSLIFLLNLYLILGMLYAHAHKALHKHHIVHESRWLYNKEFKVKGFIVSDISHRAVLNAKKNTFTLEVDEIKTKWGWKKKKGKLLVNVFQDIDLNYGDAVVLSGKMHRPFNFSPDQPFSYAEYLAQRGIYHIFSVKKSNLVEIDKQKNRLSLKRMVMQVRGGLRNTLKKNLSKNEFGIMQALLLGERSSIPKHIRELFIKTGTAHILAISGLHIGFIAALFMFVLNMIPGFRKSKYTLSIIFLILYASMTGARPSVIRATVMVSVYFSSFIFEQESDPLNTLSLSAFLLLLFNPSNLFDIGFQLSFICVLSIMLGAGMMKALIIFLLRKPNNKMLQYIYDSLSVSAAIWVGVAGIIVYYFQIITPITILANLFIVPLLGVIVALGFGLMLTGSLWTATAIVFSVCLKFFLNMMVGIIYLMSKVPYAYIYVKGVTLRHTIVYYVLLIISCVIVKYVYSSFQSPISDYHKKIQS